MEKRVPAELEPYVVRKGKGYEAKSNMPQKLIMKFKEFQGEMKDANKSQS